MAEVKRRNILRAVAVLTAGEGLAPRRHLRVAATCLSGVSLSPALLRLDPFRNAVRRDPGFAGIVAAIQIALN